VQAYPRSSPSAAGARRRYRAALTGSGRRLRSVPVAGYRGRMFALSRWEWLLLAAAVVACPGLSFGAEPETGLFDRLDRNKDGYLTPDELAAPEAKSTNWIAIDRNRDGRI